jgi:ribosome-associated toxin RatA of RatAB toxin-antitoxin module
VRPVSAIPAEGAPPIKIASRRIIRAPVQKVFQLVSRLEAQPRVTGLWLSADLLDRRPGQLTVHYRGYFGGVPLESVQRATLQPPHGLEFRQTRGGLRALLGRFSLQPAEGGETELTMALEADVGIPMITDAAAQRILATYVERMLDKIKLTAERDLPRPVRRPREEQPAAPPDHAAPDGETALPGEEPVPEEPAPPPAAPAPAPATAAAPAGERKRRRRRRKRRRASPQSPPSSQPL